VSRGVILQVSIAVFAALSKNFSGNDGSASPRKNWPVCLWRPLWSANNHHYVRLNKYGSTDKTSLRRVLLITVLLIMQIWILIPEILI